MWRDTSATPYVVRAHDVLGLRHEVVPRDRAGQPAADDARGPRLGEARVEHRTGSLSAHGLKRMSGRHIRADREGGRETFKL
jgi:hypothetical protein